MKIGVFFDDETNPENKVIGVLTFVNALGHYFRGEDDYGYKWFTPLPKNEQELLRKYYV